MRRSIYRRGVMVIAPVLLLYIGGGAGCEEGTLPPDLEVPMIVAGLPVAVTAQQVPSGGATITVGDPDSPLNGLTIEVPAGAYSAATAFAVSYNPVITTDLVDGADMILPLIEIDNGGAYAEGLITVTFPIQIGADEFPMAFFYDAAEDRLEALPILDYSTTSLKVMTRHFSDVAVLKFKKSELAAVQSDSGFTPGVDDWQFTNEGSYAEPRGQCSGMCLTAMWYYVEKRRQGEPQLRDRYDNYFLLPDRKTAGFTLDDDQGIKLCAAAQRHVYANTEWMYFDMLDREGQTVTTDERNFYALAAAFKANDRPPGRKPEPQYLAVWKTGGTSGHAIICYRIDRGTVYVSDPNFPGAVRTITFNGTAFSPYQSGDNALAILLGLGKSYDQIRFIGKTGVYNWSKLTSLWTDLESGSIGLYPGDFPDLRLRVAELADNRQDVVDQYEVDLLQDNAVSHKYIQVSLDPPDGFEGEMAPCAFGPPPSVIDEDTIELAEGPNLIGFYVEGKAKWKELQPDGTEVDKDGMRWAGFYWVSFVYEPGEDEPPDTTCTIYEPWDRWLMKYDYDCDGTTDSDNLWHLEADHTISDHWLGTISGYSWQVDGSKITIDVGTDDMWYEGTVSDDCDRITGGETIFTDGRDTTNQYCWSAEKY